MAKGKRSQPTDHSDAEARFKEWQAAQVVRNAQDAARKLAEANAAALAALWRVRLAVADETSAVGDCDDDSAQVEQRRYQRMQALKSQWLRTTSELRALRWGTDEQDWPDEALPAALTAVELLPEDDGMDDLLRPRRTRRTVRKYDMTFYDSQEAAARANAVLGA